MKGQPGDQPVSTQDAYGNPVTLYRGSGRLQLAGEPERVVPVLRAPVFPSLMEANKQVGGQIDGLLGLTSLGDRRILLDGPARKIRLEPGAVN